MRTLAGFLMLSAAFAAPGAHGGGQDAQQQAAVAFWTSGYTGADLIDGNFQCPAPALPPISHAALPVGNVRQAILEWEKCHDGYMAALRATPIATRIPPAVLASMTPAERARAQQHVGAVLARVAAAAQANAASLMVRHQTWLGATVERVARDDRALAQRRGN